MPPGIRVRPLEPSDRAGVAAGFFADLDEAAARIVRLADEPVCPRGETAEIYEDAYRAYRRLFDGVERALS